MLVLAESIHSKSGRPCSSSTNSGTTTTTTSADGMADA